MAEDAEYFRLALAVNLLTPDVVVSWADLMVAQVEHPSASLIDVSLCPVDDPQEMTSILTKLASGGDFQITATKAFRRILGLLSERLAAGQLTHGEVACALDTLGQTARFVSEREAAFMSWADDEFALVASGIKDMDAAKKALEGFLEAYASKATDD